MLILKSKTNTLKVDSRPVWTKYLPGSSPAEIMPNAQWLSLIYPLLHIDLIAGLWYWVGLCDWSQNQWRIIEKETMWQVKRYNQNLTILLNRNSTILLISIMILQLSI